VCSTVGRSLENSLHSVIRWWAVCTAAGWRGRLVHFVEVSSVAAVHGLPVAL
jgi:hypothetical protein